jgi:hypothetical protein
MLTLGCASAPTDSFQDCIHYCNVNGYSVASYKITDNGLPCKKCNCFHSTKDALENQ